MKPSIIFLAAASALLLTQPLSALAQSSNASDKAAVRAERRAKGVEAARTFQPGEGNPIPDAKPKVSRAERNQARKERRPDGVDAAMNFHSGEGDPRPAPTRRIAPDERRAERTKQREEVKAEAKAGQIPDYGDNYGNANQK
ncbi:hypothetical protein [Variovorax sp. Sphag1AA]|uniref:hypothetical protein n=1 Tax=Variovorax sp. Sphag1AA TaxID=2587027 RepID=UPI00162270C1|nr:hypothetical protein [Variovorax sp. Sphag1AA]MBB3176370.1 hypothetical protein [Variovorax sp. Sphag1AA]